MRTILVNAIRVSIVSLLFAATTTASSAAPTERKSPRPAATAKTDTTVQRLDFDDDVVDGTLLSPMGDVIDSGRPIKHDSMIKGRSSFVAELLKSADDL